MPGSKTHAHSLPSDERPRLPVKRAPPTTRTARKRPTFSSAIDVAALPDTYAMICTGDCMKPEIEDGATLAFDKLAPCRPGDIVVIWKRPDLIGEGEPPAVVKRLTLAIPSSVTFPYVGHPDDNVGPLLAVEMLNPRRAFWIGCETVIAVHRCLGEIERMPNGRAALNSQLISDVRGGVV